VTLLTCVRRGKREFGDPLLFLERGGVIDFIIEGGSKSIGKGGRGKEVTMPPSLG